MSQRQGDVGPLEVSHCAGCGRRPEELAPIDAVGALRVLQRRCTTLAHRRPDVAPAADAVLRVPAVLDWADRRLRRLFAEPEYSAVVEAGERPHDDAAAALTLTSVPEVAERLVRTIAGATAEDWYHRRPGNEVSAAEIAWLALHEATHRLEDVELALARRAQASPRHPAASWRGVTG